MPYEPDCYTDSRVFVNKERLPVSDVNLFIRKGGPMDINRYCEFTFASPRKGVDYTDAFNGLDEENQGDWDVAKIEVKDHETEEYHLAFHGLITGVGNSSGPEVEWHARAQGPSLFANKISASKSFTDASINDVLAYCAFEFAQKLPLTIPHRGSDEDVREDDTPENLLAEATALVAGGAFVGLDGGSTIDDVYSSLTEKAFKRNRDTIADVLGWLKTKTGTRIYFQPYQDGAVLVVDSEPTARTHHAHYLDGDVNVVQNDALVELNPVNTITVNGQVGDSLFEGTAFEVKDVRVDLDDTSYQTAKARHQRLYERAGNTGYIAAPDKPVDGRTKKEVENQAKSILKTKIDETTGGDMEVLPVSPIKPFDTVWARPTCQSSPASDTKPVQYEVSRVHHDINSGDEVSKTKMNVGVHAALADIEIVNSESKEA